MMRKHDGTNNVRKQKQKDESNFFEEHPMDPNRIRKAQEREQKIVRIAEGIV
jgi:hypothetical protein